MYMATNNFPIRGIPEMTKKVLVIGGGVAGLTAASELAGLGIEVDIIERSSFPGGHAVQYACKATDQCVKCGACMVEAKIAQVVHHPKINVMTSAQVQNVSKADGFSVTLSVNPAFIDAGKCTHCGICFEKCPEVGAIVKGFSSHHTPFYAISKEKCLYFKDQSCTICKKACPERAIDLNVAETTTSTRASALILATGFTPYDPTNKPYGYGRFANVVTNLEMERILKSEGRVKNPASGNEIEHIAFIQCVGSRDAKLNHLWCSKICCGSALRMAGLIKARQPEAEITFFYMDVQTFGRDFDVFYPNIQNSIRLVRAIPGDIYPAPNDQLRVTYLDNTLRETRQDMFDLVVLSVGMTPCKSGTETIKTLKLPLDETGFVISADGSNGSSESGVFTAGAVSGPMSIPESIASGGKTAIEVAKYLNV